jgi:hypothetical protein
MQGGSFYVAGRVPSCKTLSLSGENPPGNNHSGAEQRQR